MEVPEHAITWRMRGRHQLSHRPLKDRKITLVLWPRIGAFNQHCTDDQENWRKS